MDLKKLFVYVPAASEAAFITNVIEKEAEAAKYTNKIVFLEGSNRIWVKKVFYGTDLEDLGKKFQSIWATIGLTAKEDGTSALSKTVGETTYTNMVAWIEALVADEASKRGNADDEIISSYQTADSNIISGYQTADSNIISGYQGADTAIISSYEAADSAIVTAYQNADTAIISSYEAADRAIIAQLPAVDVEGSGLDIRVDTDEQTGKKTYTVIADQSIWEFMGAAEAATVADVAATLNGQYDGPSGTGEGKVHRNPEAGDVWAVTITETGNTILYACASVSGATGTWTQIGSAQGISGVDTTKSHGIGLTNTASVVGISVEDGAIADGVTYFITGGTAYTKFNEEHDFAYAKAEAEAAAAQENAYAKAEAEAAAAQANAYAKAEAEAAAAQENAYAKAEAEAAAAQANAYAQSAADAAAAQENAYAKIDSEIDALDASFSGSQTYSDNAYCTYSLTEENGVITGASVTVNPTVIENYVVDNLWEEYHAPQP